MITASVEHRIGKVLTEVGHANASGKIKHLPSIRERHIRPACLRKDSFNLSSKTFSDVLLTELHEGSVVGVSSGHCSL